MSRGLFDQPDTRKIHKVGIPGLGGVAIYCAFVVGLLVAYLRYPAIFTDHGIHILGLLVASIFIVIVGMVDDLINVPAWLKLLFQVCAAIILIFFDYNVPALSNPLGESVQLGVFSNVFTVLWIVGIINAINLVDGLDGLASGVALIITMTMFIISLYFGKYYISFLCIGLAGGIMGFLRHNFHPAKIFMGDTGSMFIGLVIGALGLLSSQKTAVSFAVVMPIIALGYPLLDIGMAILRRLKAGKHIFTADRGHIHHILLEYGYSHRKTVVVLYVICLFFAIMAFLYATFNRYDAFIMGVLFFVALFAFVFVRFLHLAKRNPKPHDKDTIISNPAENIHSQN